MVWHLRRPSTEGNDHLAVAPHNERSVEPGLKRILLLSVETNFMLSGSLVSTMSFDWIVNEKRRVFEAWN